MGEKPKAGHIFIVRQQSKNKQGNQKRNLNDHARWLNCFKTQQKTMKIRIMITIKLKKKGEALKIWRENVMLATRAK